jgi:hypothetical protein
MASGNEYRYPRLGLLEAALKCEQKRSVSTTRWDALARIVEETGASRAELTKRAQFAERFPGEEELRNAVTQFRSWHAIVKFALPQPKDEHDRKPAPLVEGQSASSGRRFEPQRLGQHPHPYRAFVVDGCERCECAHTVMGAAALGLLRDSRATLSAAIPAHTQRNAPYD